MTHTALHDAVATHSTYAATRGVADGEMGWQYRGQCPCGATGTWSYSIVATADWRTDHEMAMWRASH